MLLLSQNSHQFSNQVFSLHGRTSVLPPDPHYHKRQTLFPSAGQRDDVCSISVTTSEYCKSSVTFRKSRGTVAVLRHVLFTLCHCNIMNVARNNNSYDANILPFFSFDDVTGKMTGANAVQEEDELKYSDWTSPTNYQLVIMWATLLPRVRRCFMLQRTWALITWATRSWKLSTRQWSFRDYCAPLLPAGGDSPKQLTVNAWMLHP